MKGLEKVTGNEMKQISRCINVNGVNTSIKRQRLA